MTDVATSPGLHGIPVAIITAGDAPHVVVARWMHIRARE